MAKRHSQFGQQILQGSLPCSDDVGAWEASSSLAKREAAGIHEAEIFPLPAVCMQCSLSSFPALSQQSPQQDVTSQHGTLLALCSRHIILSPCSAVIPELCSFPLGKSLRVEALTHLANLAYFFTPWRCSRYVYLINRPIKISKNDDFQVSAQLTVRISQ